MGGNTRIKDDAYVLSSLPGGGTSRIAVNDAWSRSPRGCTGSEICHLWLHLVGHSAYLQSLGTGIDTNEKNTLLSTYVSMAYT